MFLVIAINVVLAVAVVVGIVGMLGRSIRVPGQPRANVVPFGRAAGEDRRDALRKAA